jgi:hypothetical protein
MDSATQRLVARQDVPLDVLDSHLREPATVSLGPVVVDHGISSSKGPFSSVPEYRVTYPVVVVQALARLVAEYNRAFAPLVAANKDHDADYQHCFHNGLPMNFGVQIDMLALPAGFLALAHTLSVEEVVEVLRRRIFEIENSLAMYQLLRKIFLRGGVSFFDTRFMQLLDTLRVHTGKEIALLAVTDQKYRAMCEEEFGKENGAVPTPEEVRELSGFDYMFGPGEFMEHLKMAGGFSQFALYARTSNPTAVLKDPKLAVEHPLLGDMSLRAQVRCNVLTFNVDDPHAPLHRCINDTKLYLPHMGMGLLVPPGTDVVECLTKGRDYFASYGIDVGAVLAGQVMLRAKPALGTYGCYGHVRGKVGVKGFVGELNRERRRRGWYIIQPEFPTLKLVDKDSGSAYSAIDRVFLGWNGVGYQLLGGFRSLMPEGTPEAIAGRNHGNDRTVWAEVVG